MAEIDVKSVVDKLNDIFGSDIKNLSRAKDLKAETQERKSQLESRVNITIGNDATSEYSSLFMKSREALRKVDELAKEKELLTTEISNHLQKVAEKHRVLTKPVKEVQNISKYLFYLQWIETVEGISSDIKISVAVPSYHGAVKSYKHLLDLCNKIRNSSCANLVKYIQDTTELWYSILKSQITNEFDVVIKHVRWPILSGMSNEASTLSISEAQTQLNVVIVLLLDLERPAFSQSNNENQILLPIQLLLRPLRKRFLYHFCGSRQTNNIEKPEWYLTQILAWIKDNSPFLEVIAQPIFDGAGYRNVNVRIEFIKGLVQLVTEKMTNDIPQIIYNEHLLSHLIDEVLLFDKELRVLKYPYGYPSCLTVLTASHSFPRWINMERQYSTDKMDAILASSTVWDLQYGDQGDVDEMKVTECGESFMTLLLTITERYKVLSGAAHRLKFLNLQLELIDDFRIRLLQLMKLETPDSTVNSNYCAILNTVAYVTSVLKEWSDLPFFLQLQYYRLQFESLQTALALQQSELISKEVSHNTDLEEDNSSDDGADIIGLISQKDATSIQETALASITEDFSDEKLDYIQGTVFSDVVSFMEKMIIDMINSLVEQVMLEVRARSMPYRKEKWFSMTEPPKGISLSVTATGSSLLSILKYHLHSLHQKLATSLFSSIWQAIARRLNTFLLQEIILVNHFNTGGAAQIQVDITRNLFPIFGEFTPRPDNYFKDLKEGCILLNLKPATAYLLRDVLDSADKPSLLQEPLDDKHALNEQGIHRLSSSLSLRILNLRVDLSSM